MHLARLLIFICVDALLIACAFLSLWCVALLQHIDITVDKPQALVLSPKREYVLTLTLTLTLILTIDKPQALALSPIREYAWASHELLSNIGEHTGVRSKVILGGTLTLTLTLTLILRSKVILGGTPFQRSIEALKAGPHVVIATPGRVWDLMERGCFDTTALKFLILDEVTCTDFVYGLVSDGYDCLDIVDSR